MQKLNPATSGAPLKKPSLANARTIRGSAAKSASIKPAPPVSRHDSSSEQKHNVLVPTTVHVPSRAPALVPYSSFVSPGRSRDSVSTDETMSTCDSMKSPDFEYIDNGGCSMLASLQRRADEHLRTSEDRDVEGLLRFRFPFLSMFLSIFLLIQPRVACFLLQKISGRKMALPQWKSTASVKLTVTSRIHSCAPLWLLTSTCICEKLR
jgi:hypothetical protein